MTDARPRILPPIVLAVAGLAIAGCASQPVTPAAAVISLIAPKQQAAGGEVGIGFCRHAHFFASPAAAGRWRAAHESVHLVPVAQAHLIARRIRALRDAGPERNGERLA